MKALINYVVQDAKEHTHHSEILEISSPPYTFSSDPPVHDVMKWVEKQQNTLPEDQKIVLISMYKI